MNNIERVICSFTTKCFSGCKMCCLAGSDALPNEITADEVIRFLKHLILLRNNFDFNLAGGEPLTRYEDTSKIFKFCKDLKIYSALNTNGFLIPNDIEKFLDDVPMNCLQMSIESDNEEENDNIRGLKGHFKKVLKVANDIRNYSDKHGIKLLLVSATVVTKDNYNRMILLEQFFKANGFHDSQFNMLAYHDSENFKEERIKYSKEKSINDLSEYFTLTKTKTCAAKKFRTIILNSAGFIQPCFNNSYMPQDLKFNNIKNNSIQTYFKSDEYLRVVDLLSKCDPLKCHCSGLGCYK
jgi:MoaA/NifB/PqqE/SkfB family radical SAM enzyme